MPMPKYLDDLTSAIGYLRSALQELEQQPAPLNMREARCLSTSATQLHMGVVRLVAHIREHSKHITLGELADDWPFTSRYLFNLHTRLSPMHDHSRTVAELINAFDEEVQRLQDLDINVEDDEIHSG
ncbi:hypothetical protein D5S17_09275 [Pseudonocardiaceae bacterium YIM PH 21723]|nr:hypothetical protein D5S17_09275 [Pseudonocardiaceae bacterium YIM PH 21723]